VRTVLDNGVVFLAKETRTTPAVSINLALRAGSICDPPGAEGTTWLLSRVIDRGTASRSADAIAEDLDGRGITLTVTVTRHLLSLVCTCLAEDFEPVLALLGDVIMAPIFPESEVATRKGEVITSIRQDQDSPAVLATETLMALLYPDGHPYGRRTKGTLDIVESLTRDRLEALHAQRFAPSELTAVVVGDVDVTRARDAAARVFGGWKKPAPPAVAVAPPPSATTRRRVVIPMMNKAQADVAYGFTAIRRRDPEVLRVLADEQRARPILNWWPAGRQHPRAAGDGVLRVQLAGREYRRGAAHDSSRRQPGERGPRDRVG